MIYMVNSPERTEEVGRELGELLAAKGILRAYIAMKGEMGVGKTVFTRGFASAFGIKAVKSPTYTVVNEYRGAECSVFHFDLYRIEDADDLYSVGYDEYINRRGYCIVEWSERVEEEIPKDAITVSISRVDNDPEARIIEILNLPDEVKK